MKKKLISLVQLCIGIGLIALIIWRMKATGNLVKIADAVHAAASNWPLLLLGFAVFFACILLCAIRWDVLLKAQGVRLPFGRILVLYFIGHFFSSFMLGATGGDVVKAYYVAKETSGKKTEVVSTVFIDRIIGLLAVIGLMVFMMLVRLPFFLAHRETKMAMVFSLTLLLLAVGGLLVVFHKNLFERWSFFRNLEGRTAFGEILQRAYNAFHLCFNQRGMIFKTIVLSLVNDLGFVMCAWLFGMALEVKLSFWNYLTIIPTIAAVSAVPLTPGGLGTREATAIYMFGIFNVPAASAFMISILLYFGVLLWAIVGGVIYTVWSSAFGWNVRDKEELQV
jgi:glycosyltransferase 2 family protein